MPHDKSGNPLMVGDWVAGRIERSPGKVWEGIGRVVELRDGPVCNITIATIENTRAWTDDDNLDIRPGVPYMSGPVELATHRGKHYRLDVMMIDCSADSVQLVQTGSVTRAFVTGGTTP